jgi:hypothetical protein
MDEIVNRFARELAEAIAAAVAHDPRIEGCRAKARAAGFEMRVTLEAIVGFVNRANVVPAAKVAAPQKAAQNARPFAITAADRRFLRSLRIATDELPEDMD